MDSPHLAVILFIEAVPPRDERTPTPPVVLTQTSDPRRPRRIPSQDMREYDGLPSNQSPMVAARIPSNGPRRPSPIPSRPSTPPDSSQTTITSARPRQPSQSSSVAGRPPRIRPAGPRLSALSDVTSIQLPSPTRLSTAAPFSDSRSSLDPDRLSIPQSPVDRPSPVASVNRSAAATVPSDYRRSPSPASSSGSKAKGRAQSRGPPNVPVEQAQLRRDQNARVSFFDPANQSALDRLIFRGSGTSDPDGEEETTQDIIASVEEMLEGYEWASDDILGRSRSKGAVDQIAARLLDELMALEKVVSIFTICSGIDPNGHFHRRTFIPSSNQTIVWHSS